MQRPPMRLQGWPFSLESNYCSISVNHQGHSTGGGPPEEYVLNKINNVDNADLSITINISLLKARRFRAFEEDILYQEYYVNNVYALSGIAVSVAPEKT